VAGTTPGGNEVVGKWLKAGGPRGLIKFKLVLILKWIIDWLRLSFPDLKVLHPPRPPRKGVRERKGVLGTTG